MSRIPSPWKGRLPCAPAKTKGYGIPKGLRYLTGFVFQAGIWGEDVAA
jgi:hypothetical protein